MVGPRSNRLVYAILFIFGLSCFALASVAICLLAVIGVIKGVYFVGSLFLYHRGVAVIHRISQRRPHRCQPGRWRWVAWKPRNASYMASGPCGK